MPRTKKPCPGCGKPPVGYRDADLVCVGCQRLMHDGEQFRKLQENNQNVVIVRLPSNPGGMKHIHHAHKDFCRDKTAIQKYQEAIHRLAVRLSTPGHYSKEAIELFTDRGNHYVRDDYIELPRDTLTMLEDIDFAAREMVENAFRNGKEDGTRFIVGLAKGSVSIDEFNDKTIKSGDDDYD